MPARNWGRLAREARAARRRQIAALEAVPEPELRRLLELRIVWSRMRRAAETYAEGLLGPEARHLAPDVQRRMLEVLSAIEEHARTIEGLSPTEAALFAGAAWRRLVMRPSEREEHDRIALSGRLNPGRGGGRTSARWKKTRGR